ncbi:peptidase s49 : Uncharacterized protein OS=Isosphaera pallida (strain ATCC 43644 / DSM 9630 / IS1B) GN=Isop_2434 PE=4 SV=1: Peptidase_S49 [Gemmata massiliana]|uniref:Peptidase S49 domain-containing protein n=1 Tax=Gemmata massiliana TaxID=1210884 RepID=A0A6P2DBU0_9BACT|nr:S49 family peptidase [Gemmata massiliana]VTR99228.1 peptidase s49 : Uncharacterized protein OS=Isosphaera pallida (strain ATCC 43644 / DSM 9630 / IS1B) GN=Isop_2434 PE=4 SV=1: Peptidase_S49 [Gemmata massiliana]
MRPELNTLTVPTFPRATDYAGVWAIEPSAGAALWSLAQRMDLAAHVSAAESPKLAAAEPYQTVKAGAGQQIAVIPIAGALMKAQGSMSSATSTVAARRAVRKAAADPDVSAILLHVDSPGGTVSGTADLAADVKAASKQKPVWAFAEDLCASAAYWIASQADQIFANTATAMIGSIGTLAVVYDLSGAAEQQGIKALVFGTGPIKGAGTPGAPVTEEQQAYFRDLVEGSQKSFDAAVQKSRALTDKQLAAAKTGGVFGAPEALERKLIDGIQSFDQTVAGLAAEARRANRSSTTRATGPIPDRSAAVEENVVPTQTAAGTVPTVVVAQVPAPSANDPIALMRQQAAAEVERISGINRVCGTNTTLAAQAIREGWAVERAELSALRASLASGVSAANPHAGPALNFGRGRWRMGAEAAPGVSASEALEAALRMTLGRNVDRDYRAEVCQAAHESFRNFGLQQVLMLAAIQNGYPGSPGERVTGSNLRAVLKAAFTGSDGSVDLRAAGVSNISMSGILGNVANKELLSGYVEEDMTWKEIAAVKSVSNFQQVTSYRMLDDMEYEELGPDGKIKHGTAGQESYTRQARTYAKMFTLARTDIINDDLGAFDDIRTRLGRGSSKKFNKIFWAKFINNATFFTAGRTNYISGSTTNLGTDGVGLGLGVQAFRKMKSPSADGTKAVNADTQNPVGSAPGGRPEILLVPPELEGIAEVLYRNQNLGAVASNTANIYANKYRPVVAWQLSDPAYTGYSATAWHLLNNPAYLAAVVVSFLNGNMSPTVESADADFDELGVRFRGVHDFGCDQAEYLAGVKSKGAA